MMALFGTGGGSQQVKRGDPMGNFIFRPISFFFQTRDVSYVTSMLTRIKRNLGKRDSHLNGTCVNPMHSDPWVGSPRATTRPVIFKHLL